MYQGPNGSAGVLPTVSDSAAVPVRPTWYAGRDTWYGEAWTMLHLPYTAMVLSFVVAGAAVSPRISWTVLGVTLLAYFLALGIGAHFLDQLPGMGSHYVRHWPTWTLALVGFGGVGAGVVLGVVGAFLVLGPTFLLFVFVQTIGVLGYPLAPLFHGVLHRDSVFAISWGCLPFLTSYYAQSGQVVSAVSVALAAVFAAIALAEIRVSRSSRQLRRRAQEEDRSSGTARTPETPEFLRPDRVLKALSLGTVVVSTGSLVVRVIVGG